MKKIHMGVATLAAIAAVAGASAFTPKSQTTGNTVYAALGSSLGKSTTYFYSNNDFSGNSLLCRSSLTTYACSFTSTATASYFNDTSNPYLSTFPSSTAHSGSQAEIGVSPSGLIWK